CRSDAISDLSAAASASRLPTASSLAASSALSSSILALNPASRSRSAPLLGGADFGQLLGERSDLSLERLNLFVAALENVFPFAEAVAQIVNFAAVALFRFARRGRARFALRLFLAQLLAERLFDLLLARRRFAQPHRHGVDFLAQLADFAVAAFEGFVLFGL